MNIALQQFTIKDIDTSISKELQKLDIIIGKIELQAVRVVLEKATRIFNVADFKIRIIYNFEITLRNISNRFVFNGNK